HDARRHALEQVVGKARPVRGHEVFGRHGAERDERAVGAEIALHPDAPHRREDRERLRDGAVEVRAPERLETFAIDRSEYAHRETRPGERMPPEDVFGYPELGSHAPDLILEEA